MSIWATYSSRIAAAALIAAAGANPAPVAAQAQLSLQEAVTSAFPPPAVVERRTAFLSEERLSAAQALAGSDAPVTQSVVTYYVAHKDGAPVGVAYFDSHRVRTLNEVLMIVVLPDDRIGRIEVLRFAEPPEYHATGPWLEQFHEKGLNEDLSLKGSIRMMTGATLTSNATVRAARRVLALHQQIHPFAQAGAQESR
jgi:Na+-translocating ferredoxin:NAD+ oxidoreductase RnfG subunit